MTFLTTDNLVARARTVLLAISVVGASAVPAAATLGSPCTRD